MRLLLDAASGAGTGTCKDEIASTSQRDITSNAEP